MASDLLIGAGVVYGETSLKIPEGVSYEEWRGIWRRLQKVGRAHQWWIGDCLNFGERKWGEKYADALEETDLEYQTLANAKWVAGKFDVSRRREKLPFWHHDAVAKLPPELADPLLDAALAGRWTQKQIRTAVSILNRQLKHQEIAGEAREIDLGSARFALIYADPPWSFKTYSELGKELTSPEQHYPTMTLDEICEFEIQGRPIRDVAELDAGLFLWCTSSNVHFALDVVKAWGFEFKTHLAWNKIRPGTGYIFLNQHELLLYCSRGEFPMPALKPVSVHSELKGKHSVKPRSIRQMLESMYPEFTFANRLELFARGEVPGWTTWGNEA